MRNEQELKRLIEEQVHELDLIAKVLRGWIQRDVQNQTPRPHPPRTDGLEPCVFCRRPVDPAFCWSAEDGRPVCSQCLDNLDDFRGK